MANPFLTKTDLMDRDVETALMLEKAIIHDIDKAVAFTDGKRIFINTEDNLFNILPAYDHRMLKWLLWHERMHLELKHHSRYFKYKKEAELVGSTLKVTHNEVNIIMDILVHDWMCKKFPDLVETAVNNLAQMRNRNSLKYTFKTHTLEEMLQEYADHKKEEDGEGPGGGGEGPSTPTDESTDDPSEPTDEPPTGTGESTDKPSEEDTPRKPEDSSGHGASGIGKDYKEVEITDALPPEHDKTDWSKLADMDSKEFIDKDDGEYLVRKVEKLKIKKLKLARLTETLNGMVTSTRRRSYAMPSTIHCGHGILLKGSTPGRTQLYLCFDASGSMGREMETFKDIISKSIPQAMDTPTAWFSGYAYRGSVADCKDPTGRSRDYYKGKFKDFMKVQADNGYGDDGDRTIEMCWKAEQMGYSPIGVTDGGGTISWSKDMLKQLKRTVLVGQNKWWLDEARKINPHIQIIDTEM